MNSFEHRSVIAAPVERILSFHQQRDALSRLTMPPLFMQVLDDQRRSLTEGRITFRMWIGPIPVKWVAEHQPGPTETSFADEMRQGPMQHWRHEHIFTPVSGGTELHDRIVYAYPAGLRGALARLLFNPVGLRVLFTYRHWQTRRAVA